MTSANGGTYAGQYPCYCWVYNLEPTQVIAFLSDSGTRSEETH